MEANLRINGYGDLSRHNEIYPRVRELLVQSLNVDENDVSPTSKILGDLGAESIDMLDITFRVEREFKISIPREELFPTNVFNGDNACLKDGQITTHGIDKLQAAAPHVTFRDDKGNLTFDGTVAGVGDAFTVSSLVNYVINKLKEQK